MRAMRSVKVRIDDRKTESKLAVQIRHDRRSAIPMDFVAVGAMLNAEFVYSQFSRDFHCVARSILGRLWAMYGR